MHILYTFAHLIFANGSCQTTLIMLIRLLTAFSVAWEHRGGIGRDLGDQASLLLLALLKYPHCHGGDLCFLIHKLSSSCGGTFGARWLAGYLVIWPSADSDWLVGPVGLSNNTCP